MTDESIVRDALGRNATEASAALDRIVAQREAARVAAMARRYGDSLRGLAWIEHHQRTDGLHEMQETES